MMMNNKVVNRCGACLWCGGVVVTNCHEKICCQETIAPSGLNLSFVKFNPVGPFWIFWRGGRNRARLEPRARRY